MHTTLRFAGRLVYINDDMEPQAQPRTDKEHTLRVCVKTRNELCEAIFFVLISLCYPTARVCAITNTCMPVTQAALCALYNYTKCIGNCCQEPTKW